MEIIVIGFLTICDVNNTYVVMIKVICIFLSNDFCTNVAISFTEMQQKTI